MHELRTKSLRPGEPASLQTSWTTRQVSRLLIALLAVPLTGSATGFAQQATPPPQTAAVNRQAPAPGPRTEVASTSLLPADVSGDATPDAPQPQNTTPQQQSNPQQQQPAQTQPLGTAAAPYEQPSGITASRPAGAAIAPAKQRRTRTLIIRVGVLVAAAVAVGTVVALSSASHSTPH